MVEIAADVLLLEVSDTSLRLLRDVQIDDPENMLLMLGIGNFQ
jgi:hypothetical protein